jgi:hypothetical protein
VAEHQESAGDRGGDGPRRWNGVSRLEACTGPRHRRMVAGRSPGPSPGYWPMVPTWLSARTPVPAAEAMKS